MTETRVDSRSISISPLDGTNGTSLMRITSSSCVTSSVMASSVMASSVMASLVMTSSVMTSSHVTLSSVELTLFMMKSMSLLRYCSSITAVYIFCHPSILLQVVRSPSISGPISCGHMKQMPCPRISRTRKRRNGSYGSSIFWAKEFRRFCAFG